MKKLVHKVENWIQYLFGCGLLWFLVGCGMGYSIPSQAQQVDSTILYYQQYLQALDSEEYVNAVIHLASAVRYESDKETPNDSLMGLMSENFGWLYSGTTYAHYYLPAYHSSVKHYHNSGNSDLAYQSYSQLPSIYEKILQNNLPVLEKREEDPNEKYDTINAFFRVDSVLNVDSKGGLLIIRGGINQGVFEGSIGGLLTGNNDSMEERENIVLGDAKVLSVNSHSSVVEISFASGMDKYGLMLNDLVRVQLRAMDSLDLGIFSELIKHDIIFSNLNRQPYYTAMNYQFKASAVFESYILESMQAELIDIAIRLSDNEDFNSNRLAGGKFNGMSTTEALEKTGLLDIRNFLSYVNEYPFGYMGMDYTLANTYATWIENGTPVKSLTNFKEQLLDKIRALPNEKDFVDNHRFDYAFYLDQALGNGSDYITELYDAYLDKPDASQLLLDKLIWIAADDKADTFYNNMVFLKAYFLADNKQKEEAKDLYQELIDNGILKETAYWYRSSLLFEEDDYTGVIRDCDSIIALGDSTWIPFIKSTKGAALFRLGEWKKAKPLFWEAHQYDPYNAIKTMNVGMSQLFSGAEDSAKYYFDLGFGQMSYVSEYEAITEAFDYNMTKGWMEIPSQNMLSYLNQQWDSTYHMKVLSDQHWESSQTAYKVGNYQRAIRQLDTAIWAEYRKTEINYRDLRTYKRWKAYCYYKLETYDSSVVYYHQALDVNKKHIKDDALLVDDFDDVGNLYSHLNDDLNERIYDGLEYGLAYKLKMDTFMPKLYVLAISNSSDNSPFEYCKKDVLALYESLAQDRNKLYRDIEFIHLEQGSRKELQDAFLGLSSKVEEDDVLLIHIAAPSYVRSSDKGIVLGKDSVSLKKFFTNLSYVNASQILTIADIPGIRFVEEFVSFKNRLYYDQDQLKNVQFFCPSEVRMEDQSIGHSSFIQPILDMLKDSGKISTQDLGWSLLQDYTLSGPRLAVSSYQTGRPFTIYSSDSGRVVNTQIPENPILSRGVTLDDFDYDDGSKAKDYALLFATNSYDQWGDLNNPVNDAKDLQRILEDQYGFEVELVIDASQREIMRKIKEYKDRDFNSEDQLLIYFAGHGYYDEDDEDAYLVCKNSVLNDEEKLDGYPSYLHYSYFNSNIGQMKSCRNVFMIMDVCFGGTFFDNTDLPASYRGVKDDEIDKVIRNKREIQTRVYLTSGGKEYVPDGTPGANSPFSSKLILALEDRAAQDGRPKDYVTMEDIISYMHALDTKVKYGTFGVHKANGDFVFEYHADDDLEDLQIQIGNVASD